MQPLTSDVTRRLALIRLLLAKAEQESRLSAPYSTDSINRLHDVAEMFLALAAQQHHRTIPKEFEKYWDVLEPVLGRPLSYRAQMQKFNKLRVNLKHYGVEPALQEIESSRIAVRGLLYDETLALFGLALDKVSLSNFVNCKDSKEFLDSAESRWSNSDHSEAFADLAESFVALIKDYKRRKLVWADRSVFDITTNMRMLSPFFRRVTGKEKQFDEAVIDSLNALDFTVTLVGLGIDMRRYGKFKGLTPNVMHLVNGGRVTHDHPGVVRSSVDFEFCRDFVISTAIHLAEFDYDFDLWSAYREASRTSAAEADKITES